MSAAAEGEEVVLEGLMPLDLPLRCERCCYDSGLDADDVASWGLIELGALGRRLETGVVMNVIASEDGGALEVGGRQRGRGRPWAGTHNLIMPRPVRFRSRPGHRKRGDSPGRRGPRP